VRIDIFINKLYLLVESNFYDMTPESDNCSYRRVCEKNAKETPYAEAEKNRYGPTGKPTICGTCFWNLKIIGDAHHTEILSILNDSQQIRNT